VAAKISGGTDVYWWGWAGSTSYRWHETAGNVRGPKVQIVDWPSYAKQYVGGIASCRLVEV
jgi:hypothetical protein